MYLNCFILIITLAFTPLIYADGNQEKYYFSEFSKGLLDDWEEVEFNGETHYVLESEQTLKSTGTSANTTVLKANSHATASGMFKKMKVNIKEFPVINWRWKLTKALPSLAEKTKQGDDYAARIYVVVSDGWFFWQTKALNYVWSSREQENETWPNAYAPDNTLMMALRTKKDQPDVWFEEKRNIAEDLKQWLGKSYDQIEAIAIMTDSDDSKLDASAVYGDIYFTAE